MIFAGPAVKKLDCMMALRALAEENRLRILRLLLSEEMSVAEISERLGIPPYNSSKHLRILREAGLVASTKHAQQRFYTLAPDLRRRLSNSANVLDLGCCQFDFDRLPK
jgi:DNA-binding transcriptional ArsR family regulator